MSKSFYVYFNNTFSYKTETGLCESHSHVDNGNNGENEDEPNNKKKNNKKD
jgi:hypothetical protein